MPKKKKYKQPKKIRKNRVKKCASNNKTSCVRKADEPQKKESPLQVKIESLLLPSKWTRRLDGNWVIQHKDLRDHEEGGWELSIAKENNKFGYTIFAQNLESLLDSGAAGDGGISLDQFKLGRIIILVSSVAYASRELTCLSHAELVELKETIRRLDGKLLPILIRLEKLDLSQPKREMLHVIDGIWGSRSTLRSFKYHQIEEIEVKGSPELTTLKDYGFSVHKLSLGEPGTTAAAARESAKYILKAKCHDVNLLYYSKENFEDVVRRSTRRGVTERGGEIRTAELTEKQLKDLCLEILFTTETARSEAKPLGPTKTLSSGPGHESAQVDVIC